MEVKFKTKLAGIKWKNLRPIGYELDIDEINKMLDPKACNMEDSYIYVFLEILESLDAGSSLKCTFEKTEYIRKDK